MSDKRSIIETEKQRQCLLREWRSRHFINMLDQIVEMQKRFGKKFVNFDRLSIKQKERWTKEFVLCAMSELYEVLNQMN